MLRPHHSPSSNARSGRGGRLAGGPQSADDLATASGAHAPPLSRVLRLLASEGVFAQTQDGWLALTLMTEALQRDVPARAPG